MHKDADRQTVLPLVTLGMPVFNEERFLEESLRSMLVQDYQNLEIVISDNASSDRTERICREFARSDSRIRYHRFDVNQGAAANFKRVMDDARGTYFMWAAGHDRWSPGLVSECVGLLESEPTAVLAYASSAWIDAAGQRMEKTWGWTDTRGMSPVGRFFTVFWGNMHPIYGLIRMQALRRVPFLACAGTDLLILCQLALTGDFVHARSAEWSRREFRKAESHRDRLKRYRSVEFGLSRSMLDRLFPMARLPLELAGAILRAPISWYERLGMLLVLLPSLLLRYLIGRRHRSDVATCDTQR